MSHAICETRTYKIKSQENYKIPSKGMILSWTVNDKSLCPTLYIDGEKVEYSFTDNSMSIKELRDYISTIVPMTREEDSLVSLGDKIYLQQLYGMEYYKHLSNTELSSCIFTRDMNIQILFSNETSNGSVDEEDREVEITEIYYKR